MTRQLLDDTRDICRESGATVAAGDARALVQAMTGHVRAQQNLCNSLENVADRLPDCTDRGECLHLAWSLGPVLRQAHAFEEKELYPALIRSHCGTEFTPVLERLHGEHLEDQGYAAEVSEALIDLVLGRSNRDVETVGYMFRGFFTALRRHMAFDQEFVRTLLKGQDGTGRPA